MQCWHCYWWGLPVPIMRSLLHTESVLWSRSINRLGLMNIFSIQFKKIQWKWRNAHSNFTLTYRSNENKELVRLNGLLFSRASLKHLGCCSGKTSCSSTRTRSESLQPYSSREFFILRCQSSLQNQNIHSLYRTTKSQICDLFAIVWPF